MGTMRCLLLTRLVLRPIMLGSFLEPEIVRGRSHYASYLQASAYSWELKGGHKRQRRADHMSSLDVGVVVCPQKASCGRIQPTSILQSPGLQFGD